MLFGISLPVWDLPACPLPPFYSMLISKGTPKFFAEAEAQKINFEINFEFMGGGGGWGKGLMINRVVYRMRRPLYTAFCVELSIMLPPRRMPGRGRY